MMLSFNFRNQLWRFYCQCKRYSNRAQGVYHLLKCSFEFWWSDCIRTYESDLIWHHIFQICKKNRTIKTLAMRRIRRFIKHALMQSPWSSRTETFIHTLLQMHETHYQNASCHISVALRIIMDCNRIVFVWICNCLSIKWYFIIVLLYFTLNIHYANQRLTQIPNSIYNSSWVTT